MKVDREESDSLRDETTPDEEWFENWKHRRPDEHLWHFDKESLVNFMNRMGYVLVSHTNLEDTIRKNSQQKETNILTCVFRKT